MFNQIVDIFGNQIRIRCMKGDDVASSPQLQSLIRKVLQRVEVHQRIPTFFNNTYLKLCLRPFLCDFNNFRRIVAACKRIKGDFDDHTHRVVCRFRNLKKEWRHVTMRAGHYSWRYGGRESNRASYSTQVFITV